MVPALTPSLVCFLLFFVFYSIIFSSSSEVEQSFSVPTTSVWSTVTYTSMRNSLCPYPPSAVRVISKFFSEWSVTIFDQYFDALLNPSTLAYTPDAVV